MERIVHRGTWFAGALAAGTLLVVLARPAPSEARVRTCAPPTYPSGISRIEVRGDDMACATARRVATRFNGATCPDPRGYECTIPRGMAGEDYRFVCEGDPTIGYTCEGSARRPARGVSLGWHTTY